MTNTKVKSFLYETIAVCLYYTAHRYMHNFNLRVVFFLIKKIFNKVSSTNLNILEEIVKKNLYGKNNPISKTVVI